MQQKQETQVRTLGQEDPWSRKWNPTPVFLPGESYGQTSLAGYSPWNRTELDTTEQARPCITTTVTSCHKLSGLNNINLFSFSSGGQKSKISVTELRLVCPGAFEGRIYFLTFFSFCWPTGFLGLWPPPPSSKSKSIASVSVHVTFSSVPNFRLPLSIRTLVITLRVHLDNPG